MDEKIKFPSNVLLIDAAFLNLVVTDLKKYFEKTLMRELQEIDLFNIFQLIMLFSPQVIKKIDIFRYLCASNYKELYDFDRRTSRRV